MFKLNPVAWLICIAMLPLSGCDQKTVANTMGEPRLLWPRPRQHQPIRH